MPLQLAEQARHAVTGPIGFEAGDHRTAPEEARRAGAVRLDVGRAGEPEDVDRVAVVRAARIVSASAAADSAEYLRSSP